MPVGSGTVFQADGSFEQSFLPHGEITISRSIEIGQGASMSFRIEKITLGPGQTHKIEIGKPADDIKDQILKARKR